MTIMRGALDAVETEAAREGESRVLVVRMRIGALSGVVTEALRFAFEVLRAGTAAGGAILEIEEVPVACYCEDCGREFEPPPFIWECPSCGRNPCKVTKGREVEIASIEVE
jgi:hydrogenase nickel incorporation protein HypA/HybF